MEIQQCFGKVLTSKEKIKPKHRIVRIALSPTLKVPIFVVSANKPLLQQPTSPEMVNLYSDTVCDWDCTLVKLITEASDPFLKAAFSSPRVEIYTEHWYPPEHLITYCCWVCSAHSLMCDRSMQLHVPMGF